MAGAGFKTFNTGDVLTAADVNTYLQQQVTMVFASAAARTTALSGVLAEGMMSYLQDTNSVEVYDGSSWVSIGSAGDITGVTAGTGISGGGTTGTVTITNDMATTITAAGDIVVGTGSGTYDNLPIGSTGQILTADTTVSPYKVKWASAGATGALTLISSTTFSGVASQTFDNVFTTTYDNYMVTFTSMSAVTNSDDFLVRPRYDVASPQDLSGTCYWNCISMTASSTTVTGTNGNGVDMFTIGLDTGSSTEPSGAILYFNNVGNQTNKGLVWGDYSYGGLGKHNWFCGDAASGAGNNKILTGFKVYTSSTNISGTVRIYGIAKS